MEKEQVESFIMANSEKFPEQFIPAIRSKLLNLSESDFQTVSCIKLKNPTTALILSLLLGPLGVDRFYNGDTIKGILKMVTCGGLLIWTWIDWFKVSDATKQINYNRISVYL